MLRKSFFTLFLGLFLFSSSQAFDGNKKGFTLSGGFVYMPEYSWSNNIKNTNGSTTGSGIRFNLGHNWNGKDRLSYEMIVVGNKGNKFFHALVYQGIVWSHDFEPLKNSFFIQAGAGVTLGGIEHGGFGGGGFKVGGGYEVSRHIQFSFEYIRLKHEGLFFTKYDYDIDVVIASLSFYAF